MKETYKLSYLLSEFCLYYFLSYYSSIISRNLEDLDCCISYMIWHHFNSFFINTIRAGHEIIWIHSWEIRSLHKAFSIICFFVVTGHMVDMSEWKLDGPHAVNFAALDSVVCSCHALMEAHIVLLFHNVSHWDIHVSHTGLIKTFITHF